MQVEMMVGPGQDAHSFAPTARQMARLGRAQIYFSIGLPFEQRLLEKIGGINAALSVIDSRAGIPLRTMSAGGIDEHGNEDRCCEKGLRTIILCQVFDSSPQKGSLMPVEMKWQV